MSANFEEMANPREAFADPIVVECENGLFVFASDRGPGAKRWFFPKGAIVKCALPVSPP